MKQVGDYFVEYFDNDDFPPGWYIGEVGMGFVPPKYAEGRVERRFSDGTSCGARYAIEESAIAKAKELMQREDTRAAPKASADWLSKNAKTPAQ